MEGIEDFKKDLKEKQYIKKNNKLTDYGKGYLTAIERYEKLILSGANNTFNNFYKPTFEQFIKGSKLKQGVDGKYFYEDSLYTYAQLFCKYKKLFDL
ncbi:hypothetical protein Phi19:3_gp111 [Cellulophaga phage phi19:3]|uniref:Uncharacterized protein n=1 Tax=Cellulophaga phage phi19:3 TaxID=1327971 RepID=R9ZYE2_9CAUD|nr:hypothetical protein Phi19:3_gp111 [Cellulophaga phage phi19:3]AGO47515.1 hypothetical protein Phi19:3_gp111 [Cellulophaga phage phi19:3]